MEKNQWAPESIASVVQGPVSAEDEATDETDYQELCRDQVTKLIKAKFSGHALTRLIEEILRAQGYHTYRSPEGADHGADIIAGRGPLGFDRPRLCVEVKSEDSLIDRPAIDKLLGAVSKFDADFGLFDAWGGFRAKTHLETISGFFQVRLWTQKEILENLFANYHKFDEELRADLPLKQIWAVAAPPEQA
jgi:restriction system protein